MTKKVPHGLEDLDKASCKEDYQNIINISKRFSKGSLELMACEAFAHIMSEWIEIYSQRTELNYKHLYDTPDTIFQHQPLSQEMATSFIQILDPVISKVPDSPEQAQIIYQAKSLKGRVYYEAGNLTQAFEIMKGLENTEIDPLNSKYSVTCLVDVLGILAHVQESQDAEQSLIYYERIAKLYRDGNEDMRNFKAFTRAIERYVYRLPLLCLRLGKQKEAFNSFRVYLFELGTLPYHFVPEKKSRMLSFYIHFLATTEDFDYYTFPSHMSSAQQGVIGAPGPMECNDNLDDEITTLLEIHFKLISHIHYFPKSNEPNPPVTEAYDNAVVIRAYSSNSSYKQVRALKEVLHQATRNTFHSTRALRLLALSCFYLKQYEDALLSAVTYIEQTISHDSLKDINTESPRKPEPPSCLIEVLLLASKIIMMKKEQLNKAYKFLYKACELYEKFENSQPDVKSRGCEVHQHLGLLHGLLAIEKPSEKNTKQQLSKAFFHYDKAIEIKPTKWELYYQASLQRAENREIQNAITLVKQALKLNSNYIPSWHLMILLLTADNDNEAALAVCNHAEDHFKYLITDPKGTVEQKTELMSLLITKALVIDETKGPSDALQCYKLLFSYHHSCSILSRTSQPSDSEMSILAAATRDQHTNKNIQFTLWEFTANVFRRLGLTKEAESALKEALKLRPFSAEAWCEYGLQNPTEAMDSFKRAIQFDPMYIPARILLAQIYIEENQLELAEIEISSARSYGGGRGGYECAASLWYYLGLIYQKTNRTELAKESLSLALELESTEPIRSFQPLLPKMI